MRREGSAPRSRRGSTSIRLDATTAAPARARGAVTRWGEDVGLDDALLLDLRLLVSEVVTNAVRHGRLAPVDEIELGVDLAGERVRVQVRDGGGGFDEYLPVPSADDVSGRGLYLVHQISSAWGLDPGPPFGIWFELERP
jgi:anti-sigma regulatory factor (Ser/Thr protein kinase)